MNESMKSALRLHEGQRDRILAVLVDGEATPELAAQLREEHAWPARRESSWRRSS